MGSFSIWHWLIVLVVVLVLFGGKGKISSLMGDFGKGLKSFKKNIKDENDAAQGGGGQSLETDAPAAVTRDSVEPEKGSKTAS
jgi:sec-independent protein translocase protein TatA